MSVTAGPDPGHLRHPCGPGDLVGALLLAGASDTSSRSNSPNVRPLAAPACEAQAAALEQLPPAQAGHHAPAGMVGGACSTPPQHSLAVAAALAAAGIPHHLHKHLLMAAAAAAAANGGNGTPCPFPQQQQQKHSLGAGPAARAPAAVALQSHHHHQQQQPCSSSTPAGSCPTTCDERAEQVLLAAEEEEDEEAAGGCGAAPLLPPIPAGHPRAWLYHLVTCQWLFKPCPACRNNHAGREVLMTFFDIDAPEHGYCTYCPTRMGRRNLLQIRRSTYHEVIKAADICRAADISGVQHYVINGSKVLFLRPRPQPRPPKGVVAPARCKVDGRQLMDHGSCYCSLRCKLEVEDPDFAANFPHDALMAADAAVDAAAQAGGSGMAAGMGTGSSSGGEQQAAAGQLLPQYPHLAAGGGHYHQLPRARAVGGMAVVGGKRSAAAAAAAAAAEAPLAPRKRTASALAAAAAACEEAEGQMVGAWGARSKRQRSAPSKYAKGAAGGSPCHHHHHEGASYGAGVLAAFRSGGRAGGAQSPAHSGDSTRSTTCHCRWAHRRKGEPVRSPLQ